jgi:hypothetical protein
LGPGREPSCVSTRQRPDWKRRRTWSSAFTPAVCRHVLVNCPLPHTFSILCGNCEAVLGLMATCFHSLQFPRALAELPAEVGLQRHARAASDAWHVLRSQVHPYTFRNEAQYIAYDFNVSARAEYELFYREMGIDGAFTVRAACLPRVCLSATYTCGQWAGS